MRWKIDENKELPLAIIEDAEDGNGIAEIGERTERNLAIAAEIVESHNRSTGEANGWISVEERLPETKQQEVLVFFGKENPPYYDLWRYSGDNQYFRGKPSKTPNRDVTHWQPLPPAPTSVPQAEPPK